MTDDKPVDSKATNGQQEKVSPDLVASLEPGKPVYYANVVNCHTSLHDLKLSFGKANPVGTSTYDVNVYLPLTTAKQLLDLIQRAVVFYEATFGPINLEPISKKDG